jgi:hypothetical protein
MFWKAWVVGGGPKDGDERFPGKPCGGMPYGCCGAYWGFIFVFKSNLVVPGTKTEHLHRMIQQNT